MSAQQKLKCLSGSFTRNRIGLALAGFLVTVGLLNAQGLDGTYNVRESWTVTLEYSDWADTGFTGTKTFSGTQTGTIVVNGGDYALIDKIGLPWTAPGSPYTNRTFNLSGGLYNISSSTYAFAPAFGAQAYGLVFLGCFAVKVTLLDGEVPAFYSYDYYSADGDGLTEISGGGNMVGSSLRATVTSSSQWVRVVGKPIISQPPQSQTVTAGQTVTFQVIAAGDPPLNYFWRKGTTTLTGKTNSTLVLTNLQASDAGGYSVIVSNAGGTITSQTAQLTVNPLPAPWFEGWENSSVGSRFPSTNLDTVISGDKGMWQLGDTVATTYPDCGLPVSHADIVVQDGRKLLKVTSVNSGTDCSDNLSVALTDPLNASLPYPLLPNTQISFFERGAMFSPEWNGYFSCILPPCGDTVNLTVTDDRYNQVLYIFQRALNYVPHTNTGYVEIFLDPAGGEFSRNLRDDFARIAGPGNVGNNIIGIEFGISDEGWAMLDDLRIGSPYLTSSDTNKPTVSISSPANLAQLTDSTVTILGTASDNVGVAFVEYRLENANGNSPYQHANGTTAWSANVTALIPGTNTLRVRALDVSGNYSTEATRTFTYVVTAPLTLGITGKGTLSPNYSNAVLELGKLQTITATAAAGYAFTNWTDGSGSVVTNNRALRFVMASNLTFIANFVDTNRPVVVITAPTVNQRWSNVVFTVKGTAGDNLGLASVQYQLNGAAWSPATPGVNWSNWTAVVNLTPGTNALRVYAVDMAGNRSPTNSVSFVYVLSDRLTLGITGKGTLSPNHSNAVLELGKLQTITAAAAGGYAFTNWTDGGSSVVTNNRALRFVMASNLTFIANFVDTNRPTVAITAPIANQRLSNAVFTVKGTAGDNAGIAGVWYQLNGSPWILAVSTNGWTNWTAMVSLIQGTNIVQAFALDSAANKSVTNRVSFVASNAFKMILSFDWAQPFTNGGLNLNLDVSPGITGRIQFSTNLVNWLPLTNFVSTNSTMRFNDRSAAGDVRRFYRSVTP